jgi:hypothetical protein
VATSTAAASTASPPTHSPPAAVPPSPQPRGMNPSLDPSRALPTGHATAIAAGAAASDTGEADVKMRNEDYLDKIFHISHFHIFLKKLYF